jgi:hypothetical protein
MNKRAKILIVIFILSCQLVTAQTQRFIEIVSVDTVELKAIEFTYLVTISTDNFDVTVVPVDVDDTDTAAMVPPPPPRQSITLSDIQRLLGKSNLNFELVSTGNYSIGGYSYNRKADSGIILHLRSEADIKKVYGILKDVDGITGKVTDVKYESISSTRNDMYKRLYDKAHADAALLAGISGSSIGKLISVQELADTDFFSSYMDFFKKIDKSDMFSAMFGLGNNFSQKIEKKLSFRFELK